MTKSLAILVVACNRPAYLERTLRSVVAHRGDRDYPLVVSQDGTHAEVTEVVRRHADIVHLQHVPDPFPDGKSPPGFDGYHRIARHYGWAFGQLFDRMGFDRVIVLEDDLEIAPDFFDYMAACAGLLERDPTIWTVSAWNDNGHAQFVRDETALFRSDFFPGLGWLMTRALWKELGPRWPRTCWDDWMRQPAQRKGRVSIRPEISRTHTFGSQGVSRGRFYEEHLKEIRLNTTPVDFGSKSLDYLLKENYDAGLKETVTTAPLVSLEEALSAEHGSDQRVEYTDERSFSEAARRFGLMVDVRGGVARTSYLGVVAFKYRDRRVFLVPAGRAPTIPRVIHQTWKTNEVPVAWAPFQRTWREHHPDWEYRFWTDVDLRELVRRDYPWFLATYDGYKQPIRRVDAARYFIMHRYGGVYADLDFECLRPIDHLIRNHEIVFGLEPKVHASLPIAKQGGFARIVCNAFLASEAWHPFWDHVFERLEASREEASPLEATGPFFLTRAYERYREPQRVYLAEAKLLYPISNEERRAGILENPPERARVSTDAFAIHHWSGSWQARRWQNDAVGDAPVVSLIIPAYNREAFIGEAIESVLRQTYGDFELVVWDDGSTDRTVEVATRATAGDLRVRVVRAEHRGVCASLNAAARELKGRYIGWVDSDDALVPTTLERTVALLEARPKVGMVYTRYLAMDENGGVLGVGRRSTIPYSKERLLTDFMTFHFRLLRRNAFDGIGGLDESIPLAEDYDLCLKLSESAEIAHIPEPLYQYRVHRDALSHTDRVGQITASAEAVRRALARRGLANDHELSVELVGKYGLRPKRRDSHANGSPPLAIAEPHRVTSDTPLVAHVRGNPAVSIVITTYNREDYVRAAIGSTLNQTWKDFELVVWDDGSTDDTVGAAERAGAGDPRVRIVRAEHRGFTGALAAALRTTSGRYVCWVDSDDALDPAALERTVALLDANPAVGMVYTQYLTMAPDGTLGDLGPRSKIPYSKERLLTDFMTFHFRLMRREAFDAAGGIDESMPIAQDYDLCLRLSEITEIRHILEPLYFHRVHDRRVSHEHRLDQIRASAEAIHRAITRRGLADALELDLEIVGRFDIRAKGALRPARGR